MFKMFKKKSIKSPISGKVIELSKIPDAVFSQKLMGEGVAIDSTGDIVYAPYNGKVAVLAETKHALVIELENGMELLIHVGLDTVNLKGEGFEALVSVGDQVKEGTPMLKIDRSLIESNGISLITPVTITNHSEYNMNTYNVGNNVEGGKDTVIEFK
ncbi:MULTISPECIES: PTS glucose transporter subunit IIA [unclassified Clostridioides]|uniref:PTS sugar transporter subunit IIA n=1 Tax=unclassified Clostridioides TaxID=2635829 RepID=UPI001D0C465C|nr:PTS glucose transporter subunit IIA [Clostridioides sp. ES-S-0001-02]MCC0639678.1 PTS glucose transporter subunit IIA [Clostridioides sp. ES-S-0049-03]MCC0651275.1 PTS glucose transporter subunit IIA [Clostridioides sp. ES-S-0001-03]MCC0655944.1 PTS glucose transporter subunit IIA [Clostridioides sp. ES-S-0123-01]MCC0676395.1 PTS glucose transporter subunit IIA [Clostridioides sp. ES-W-0018-02]MCC0702871.1 PTS glucose transporter subunit IIA [Clostridioides sp. ES-S-0049-02]MCC0711404.1 PT